MPTRLKPVTPAGEAVLELHKCPLCRGRGASSPTHTEQDQLCRTCGGTNVVSDLHCSCGRPCVWRVGNFAVCNTLSCYEEAEKLDKAELEGLKNKGAAN